MEEGQGRGREEVLKEKGVLSHMKDLLGEVKRSQNVYMKQGVGKELGG